MPRFRLAPGVGYGFISDIFVEAALTQLAVNRALEITRREELKDLNGSRVGEVERRMFERRDGHGDAAARTRNPEVPAVKHGMKGRCTRQG